MRLVATTRLVDGAVVGRDVSTGIAGQAPLLRAGTTIRPRYRSALERNGIRAIYVDDALGAGIQVPEALTEETQHQAETALTEAFDLAPAAIACSGALPPETITSLKKVVKMITAELAASGDAVLALADLANADAYTLATRSMSPCSACCWGGGCSTCTDGSTTAASACSTASTSGSRSSASGSCCTTSASS